jgi:hypothetical protein
MSSSGRIDCQARNQHTKICGEPRGLGVFKSGHPSTLEPSRGQQRPDLRPARALPAPTTMARPWHGVVCAPAQSIASQHKHTATGGGGHGCLNGRRHRHTTAASLIGPAKGRVQGPPCLRPNCYPRLRPRQSDRPRGLGKAEHVQGYNATRTGTGDAGKVTYRRQVAQGCTKEEAMHFHGG